MKTPEECTTVELLEYAAQVIETTTGMSNGSAAELRERAVRLSNVLKVAGEMGTPKEPFNVRTGATFACFELARQLNAPSALRQGQSKAQKSESPSPPPQPIPEPPVCMDCQGRGYFNEPTNFSDTGMQRIVCPTCGGTGRSGGRDAT